MRLAIVAFALCCIVGCKHQGAISPQKEVIAKPIAPKFKLEGNWVPDTDVLLPVSTNESVGIRKADTGIYKIEFPDAEGFNVEVKTTTLPQRRDYAIAEAHASSNGTSYFRFIGIIRCSDDNLSVAWIESKNLAKLMHDEGYSAVIERSAFGTKVFAEPDDLANCIAKHATELVGKPATFTRKTK